MPRIKSYTPGWLTEPAPGHSIFAPTSDDRNSTTYSSKKASRPGPRRTIARRGTEVFVAVDREIRWGDLVYLKESWRPGNGADPRIKREASDESFVIYGDEQENGSGDGDMPQRAQGYRTIKTPVAAEIRQLIISPNSNYLAVLTTHTIHICVLPDSSHLTATDLGPLKPRFYTLGPTTHVTSRSAIMSALWHPLGVNGTCIVTVTEDAVVRLWEISTADRWSFDAPTLSIDLKKLADGTNLDDDFAASKSATSTAFSPDSFDMEVAAASFAAKGSGLWSPMTLFIAMRGGDVYALCPLLPQRWAPPPMLIPSLSVAIVANLAAIEDDNSISSTERRLAQQQMAWMSDLDTQEPKITPASMLEPSIEVFERPKHPGLIPKLQGPFELELDGTNSDDELDYELSDIFVIGQRTETDDLMEGEDSDLDLDEIEEIGLSMSVICLLSTSGQIRICLDLDGVQAQWLPSRSKARAARHQADEADLPSMLVFQTLDTLPPQEISADHWPVFSEDPMSRYAFYVTSDTAISRISLETWVFRLESELSGATEAGSELRMKLLVQGQNLGRERIYTQQATAQALAACVVIQDPDLDYFVLSATSTGAVGIVFDVPADDLADRWRRATSPPSEASIEDVKPEGLLLHEPRPTYQLPSIFSEQSDLPRMIKMLKSSRYGSIVNQGLRLSPATLKFFSDAHMAISTESGRLNEAVSELFRRCDGLRAELREQIAKAADLKLRIDGIMGANDDSGPGQRPEPDDVRLKRLIEERRIKQEDLTARLERLRKQVARVSHRELGDKEKRWMQEVGMLNAKVLGSEERAETPTSLQRLDSVRALQDELKQVFVRRTEAGSGLQDAGRNEDQALAHAMAPGLRIPTEVRKAKVAQVTALLERETVLVEAVKGRLERLTLQ